jgi:hypothetical protein
MATKIILKKSSISGNIPTAAQLEVGEVAVNLADQKLYSKKADNTVVEIGGVGALNSFTDITYIDFDTTATISSAEGRLTWNADEQTLDLGLANGVVNQLGQEIHMYVKAGEAINDGDVVYASGAVGNSGAIEVSKYIANNTIEEMYVVGIATQDISVGEFGYITVFGKVRGVSTNGSVFGETWTDGTVLYASPSAAGALTSVQPEAPDQDIAIAMVVSAHATNGTLFVRAFSQGYHLGEIHDVHVPSPSNNNLLKWNATNERWEAATVNTTEVAEGTNLYYTTTRANSAIDARVTKSFVDALNVDADTLDGLNYSAFVAVTGDTMTGDLTIAKGTTNKLSRHALYIGGSNLDGTDASIYIGNDGNGQGYGWELFYAGSGSANDNEFCLKSENHGTEVDTLRVKQDGTSYFVNNVYVNSNQRVFADNYHPNADKWTTARTITLGGDLTGSVSIDGSTNVTLNAEVTNNSHTHDDRYYTESEIDTRMEYTLYDTQSAVGSDLNNLSHFGWYKWSSNSPTNAPSTYGMMIYGTDGSQNQQLVQTYGGSSNQVKLYGRRKTSGTWDTSWTQYFSDHYHPNADKLTTARTIALNGDVTGSTSFDGSGNVTITTTLNATTVDLGEWTVTETGTASAKVLEFSHNGTLKMKLDADGNLSVAGNVDSNATL